MPRVKRTVELEQYYTDSNLAAKCLALVNRRFPLGSFQIVLEPSAGDGAFFKLLPPESRVGIDVEPLCAGVDAIDFFHWEPPLFEKNILTIGNPPFGQRGSLAVAFLNRACEFSRVIGFIVPRSFKKDTFLNRVNPQFHLVEQFDCSDFRSPRGERVEVKSVFQIWERKNYTRVLIERRQEHPDFELKHAHLSRVREEDLDRIVSEFDFAIPQVGSRFLPKDPRTISAGSYWFIKAKKSGVREVFERLDFSFLDNLNLSFTSLSKKDIVEAYCNAVEQSGVQDLDLKGGI